MAEPTGENVAPAPSFTTTYSWADGGDIGDYRWSVDIEAFEIDVEDANEPAEVLIEHWERTAVEVRILFPSNAWCVIEDAEGDPCEADATHWTQEDDTWHPLCADHKDALVGRTVEVGA